MDSFGDDKISRLLRLKRYEQPPPGYFKNFLYEFHHRRQRDHLQHAPLSSVCIDGARDFVFRHNVRPLACYSAGMAIALGCAAVILITLYQQPNTTQLAVQGSPVPNAPPNTEKQLDFALLVFDATLDMQPVSESGNVWVVPVDSFRSNQFAPLNLEWDSDDDSVPLQNSRGARRHPRAFTRPAYALSHPALRVWLCAPHVPRA